MKQQASTLKSTIISKLLHSMHSQAIEEAFFHSQDSYIIACQERGPPSFSFFFDILPFFLPPFVPRCPPHTHTHAHTIASRRFLERRPIRVYTFSFDRSHRKKYTCNRQGTDLAQTNAASNYYNRPPLIIRLFSMSSSAVPRCSSYLVPSYHYIRSFDRFLSLARPRRLLLFASNFSSPLSIRFFDSRVRNLSREYKRGFNNGNDTGFVRDI